MKPSTRIGILLGLTQEQTRVFRDMVLSASPPNQRPNDFDIVTAIVKIGQANPTASEVARIAAAVRAGRDDERKLRRRRAGEMRQRQAAARAGFLRSQARQPPTAFARCRSCGKPAIPGSDMCYGCTGK
jgi:hypothetical protein